MFITDLNHLEVVDANVAGAGGVYFNSRIYKDVNINEKIKIDIDKKVNSFVDIKGNLATAQSSADAYGSNTLAETNTFVQTTPYSSESYSSGVAGTGYYSY